MKKLLVWGYALQSMDKAEKMGLPRVSSGVLGISEVFNPKKHILILTFLELVRKGARNFSNA